MVNTLNGLEQFDVLPVSSLGVRTSINGPINTTDIKNFIGAGTPVPTVTQVSNYFAAPAVAANVTATGSIGVTVGGLSVLTVTTTPSTSIIAYSFISGTGISPNQRITNQITPLISGEATGGKGRYTLSFPEPAIVPSTTVSFTTMGYYDFYLDTSRNLLHASTGQRGSIMTFDVSAPSTGPTFVGESVRLNTGSQGNSRYLTPGPTTDTLYLVTTTGGHISKFDLSGGGVPALVADYTDATNIVNPSDVQFVGNTMFVLCYGNSTPTAGSAVLSAYDATAWPPTFLSKISTSVARFPTQLCIIGNYAIFCGPQSGSASAVLQSFDISNAAVSITLVDTSDLLNRAISLTCADNYLYTTSESSDFKTGNLETYSINTTTGKLTHVNRVQTAYADNVQYNGGNYLFLGGRSNPSLAFDHGAIMLVDISSRGSPKLVYQSTNNYVEPRAFAPGVTFNSFWWGEDLGNTIHYATIS